VAESHLSDHVQEISEIKVRAWVDIASCGLTRLIEPCCQRPDDRQRCITWVDRIAAAA